MSTRSSRASGARYLSQKASAATARYDLSAIEGFILVVHTSLGGDQLVFRYPPVTRTTISEETWTAVVGRGKPSDKPPSENSSLTMSMGPGTSGGSSSVTKSAVVKTNEPPTSPNEPPVSISYADSYTPYDMPSVMLCNILSPKQSLCDRIFDTIIDQYRFFGFPSMVHRDSNVLGLTEVVKGENVATEGKSLSTSNPKNSIADSKSSSAQSNSGVALNASTSSLSASPSQNQGKDTSNASNAPGSATSTSQPSAQVQHKDELTMFNLVMVVPKEVSWEVSKMSERISIQIASALRHEQDRCHYVSSEVFKILRFRDRWFAQHRRTTPDAPPPSHTALTYEVLQNSTLAQLIKNIYHSIRDEGSAQLLVNDWVNLSLNTNLFFLPPPTPSSVASADDGSAKLSLVSDFAASIPQSGFRMPNTPSAPLFGLYSQSPSVLALRLINDAIAHRHVEGMRPLRPYHTLLLLDQSKTLEMLPADASPSLRRVVERAVPTKSFRELQLDLGIPLAQLYRIATHLVYWKCARIIHVLTRNNVYFLNPVPHIASHESMHLPFLSQTFESQFQGVKLIELLARFSTPKKLSDILQSSSSQSKFVEMVTWLLRQDLIIQLHQFCFLLCPKLTAPASPTEDVKETKEVKEASSTSATSDPMRLINSIQQLQTNSNGTKSESSSSNSPSTSTATSTTHTGSTVPAQALHAISLIPLTPSERLFLSQLDNGSRDFKLFYRLCPYFRGTNHLTEIAWRENLTKEEILKVIGMYKNLVLTTHFTEDAIKAPPC